MTLDERCIVERLSRWEQIEEVWPALESILQLHAPEVGAFSTLEFFRAWWRAYGQGRELFFLVCRMPEGQVVAVAPLFREPEARGRVLRLIGDTSDDVDGFDLIAAEGIEMQAVEAWGHWLTLNRNEWSSIELNSVPSGSRTLRAFKSVCLGMGLATRERTISHRIINLPQDWEQYRRGLSPKMRRSISHQMRVAERNWHLSLRLCRSEDQALRWLQLLAEWQHIRWASRGLEGKFESDRRRVFYEEFVLGLIRRGDLRFWALVADERVMAVELGCRFAINYIGVHSAFDPSLAAFSPGVLLQAFIVQSLIEGGMRLYDFGAGDEGYKIRWANERRTFSNLSCAPRWSSEGLHLRLADGGDRFRRKLRLVLPTRTYASLTTTWRLLKTLVDRKPRDGPASDIG